MWSPGSKHKLSARLEQFLRKIYSWSDGRAPENFQTIAGIIPFRNNRNILERLWPDLAQDPDRKLIAYAAIPSCPHVLFSIRYGIVKTIPNQL